MNIYIFLAAGFLTSFACAFSMSQCVIPQISESSSLGLLAAFSVLLLHSPAGILADKLNKNILLCAAGNLTAAACFAFDSEPFVTAVLSGLGITLFNSGCAAQILNKNSEKAAPAGYYIGSILLGIAVGIYAGTPQNELSYTVPLTALLISVLMLTAAEYKHNPSFSSNNPEVKFTKIPAKAVISLILICAAAAFHFYAKITTSSALWIENYRLYAALAGTAGLVLGGLISDKFGLMKSTVLTLIPSALLFMFFDIPACGIAALFLFHCTVPALAWTAVQILPDKKACAFGLFFSGTFFGALPLIYGYHPLDSVNSGYASCAALFLGFTYAAMRFAYDIVHPVDETSPQSMQTSIINNHSVLVSKAAE